MVFGKNAKPNLKYNNICIETADHYKYLGVIIHKSGKIKYCIKERVQKASRAINMLQGAISTMGNVSVEIALTLFDKQILPILTYGSTAWGIPNSFKSIYICHIPENVSSIEQLCNY